MINVQFEVAQQIFYACEIFNEKCQKLEARSIGLGSWELDDLQRPTGVLQKCYRLPTWNESVE